MYAVLRNVCFKGSAQVARKSSEYFHFAQQSQLLTCHLDQRTKNAVIRFPASRPCWWNYLQIDSHWRWRHWGLQEESDGLNKIHRSIKSGPSTSNRDSAILIHMNVRQGLSISNVLLGLGNTQAGLLSKSGHYVLIRKSLTVTLFDWSSDDLSNNQKKQR